MVDHRFSLEFLTHFNIQIDSDMFGTSTKSNQVILKTLPFTETI